MGIRGLFLVALSGCTIPDALEATFGPDGRTVREAVASFPEEKRRDFEVVRTRCSRCHSLNSPLAAHLPEGAWLAKVRKMARKPGAGITEGEVVQIAGFLEFYTRQRRALRNPPQAPASEGRG